MRPGWGLSREWALSSWNEGAPARLGTHFCSLGAGGVSPATRNLLGIPIRDELKLKGIGHSRKTFQEADWYSQAGRQEIDPNQALRLWTPPPWFTAEDPGLGRRRATRSGGQSWG